MGAALCALPRDDVLARRQLREREAGQRLLRSMVSDGERSPRGVDWSAVIAKAEELHRRELQYRRRRGRFRGVRERREARRRRRRESVGSFSVNLVTFREGGEVAERPGTATTTTMQAQPGRYQRRRHDGGGRADDDDTVSLEDMIRRAAEEGGAQRSPLSYSSGKMTAATASTLSTGDGHSYGDGGGGGVGGLGGAAAGEGAGAGGHVMLTDVMYACHGHGGSSEEGTRCGTLTSREGTMPTIHE